MSLLDTIYESLENFIYGNTLGKQISLFRLIEAKNIERSLELIRSGINVNAYDIYNNSLLHQAISKKLDPVALELINREANIDFENIIHATALDNILLGDCPNLKSLVLAKSKDPILKLINEYNHNKLIGYNLPQHDKIAYIGIPITEIIYSQYILGVSRNIQKQFPYINFLLIKDEMLEAPCIKQLAGFINQGSKDSYPLNKEFTINDIDYNKMLDVEKLYQNIMQIAKDNNIPVLGICGGAHHILLSNQGYLKHVPEEHISSKGIEVKLLAATTPYFLTLTEHEQKLAIEECNIPKVTFKTTVMHNFTAVADKLGDNIELSGIVTETGVAEAFHRNGIEIGLQFHPEHNYFKQYKDQPNRQKLLLDNFANYCYDHHVSKNFANQFNIDVNRVKSSIEAANNALLSRLKYCLDYEMMVQPPLIYSINMKDANFDVSKYSQADKVIHMSAGITIDDIEVAVDSLSSDLTILFKNNNHILNLKSFFNANHQLEVINFADGSQLHLPGELPVTNEQECCNLIEIYGMSYNDNDQLHFFISN